jgi:hypothetical protein
MPNAKPKQGQGTAPQSNGATLSKMEVVRRAMKALGMEAKPLAIKAWAMKNHNMDLSTDLISVYKKTIKSRAEGAGAKKSAGKRKQAASKGNKAAPTSPARSAGGGSRLSVADVQTLRGLVERLGAEQVKQLASVLGK